MKIALFALTGIGNKVLDHLVANDLAPTLVVTRKEAGPYPYADIPFLGDAAEKYCIPWYEHAEGCAAAKSCEVLVSATYHQMIPQDVIEAVDFAVNAHPSLLPKYRGPNPFFWVILRGEKKTGVSVHMLSASFDEGDILCQIPVDISKEETQGSLRRKIAVKAGMAVNRALEDYRRGALQPIPQDESLASYQPFPTDHDYDIDMAKTVEALCRLTRAASPWPLARFDGLRVREAMRDHNPMDEGEIVVQVADGRLRMKMTDDKGTHDR